MPLHLLGPRPVHSHEAYAALDDRRVLPMAALPILLIHLIVVGVVWTGVSWAAVGVCAALFFVRMFAITGFYHRYFSHRTFRTHRVTQFVFAWIGASSAQRGPMWWSGHHRHHHRHSDEDPDMHSPTLRGVLWSHMAWFMTEQGRSTNWAAVPDWAKQPELRWLERWHVVPVLTLGAAVYALGATLQAWAPGLGTSGAQMFVWGFGVSTVALYHATFTINSLAHVYGSRRFATGDDSRNNFWLALLTLGEGWHNNHHYYPGAARQGFYWWEIDPTYYTLRLMEKLGLVWNVRGVPARVYEAAQAQGVADDAPRDRAA
ncbi:MAG: acyl-CoA desaturase [Phycisphaerales bacterium]|nr:MAG: acyl-CoA desaturase [Phycisphaerales bacterium]